MSKILYIILVLLLGCTQSNNWQNIDLGEFVISVPSNTKIENINGIDSYVAKIKGRGFELMFDYGLHSPKMILSRDEYLEEHGWEDNTPFGSLLYILEPLPTFDSIKIIQDSIYQAIYNAKDCLRNDSCVYHQMKNVYEEIQVTMKDSMLIHEFTLPNSLNDYDFFIFENDSIFKRVFVSKDINKTSGVYILNKKSCIDENNCPQKLSLWTVDSVKISRDELTRILTSVELK